MNPFWAIDYLAPLWFLVLIACVAAGWVSSRGVGNRIRLGLTGLRTGALVLIGWIALNPGTWEWPSEVRESEWVILLDRSGSMEVDDGTGRSRWREAVSAATTAVEGEQHPTRARFYTFSDGLERRWEDLTALRAQSPDGPSTDILAALNQLLEEYERSRVRLDGILLLSDGRQIVPPPVVDPAVRARALGAPVYAVALGGDVERRDLYVQPIRRHFIGFAGQTVRLQAIVGNSHLGDIRPTIELRDDQGELLETQTLLIPNQTEKRIDFDVPAPDAAYQEYQIVAPEWPGEVTTANNAIRVAATFLDEPIRILFVEGIPHWDSKFLLQRLRTQPHMHVTTVHRVTTERFFMTEVDDAIGEATERAAFPSTLSELNHYDLVMFGKGAEYFLNPERIRLLRSYVEDRGGSLLFARGKPYGGTFPEMAALEPVQWGPALQRPFRWQPTAVAEGGGLIGGLLPGRADSLWQDVPGVSSAHQVAELQPFTQVWIEGRFADRRDETVPVLAVRRLGRGRSLVVNTENIWRWDFFPRETAIADFYQQFWTVLVQWMGVQSEFLPGQDMAIHVSHPVANQGQAIQAIIRRRPAEIVEPIHPQIQISRGDQVVRTIAAQAVSEPEHEWRTIFTLPEAGTYRLDVISEEDPVESAARATVEILPPPDEFLDVSADPAFLEELTRRTGGSLLDLEELDTVAERFLPERTVEETMDPVWRTRWDRWWWALLAVGLLGGEWFLRRRNGLM